MTRAERVVLLTPEMLHYIESIGDVLDHDWRPRRAEEAGTKSQRDD